MQKKLISVAIGASMLIGLVGSTAFAQSTADLQAQIAALLAQIQTLQGQLGTGGTPSTYSFTRDLTLGSSGADVKALQQFLNGHGAMVSGSGAGSPGNESTYFGARTKAALAQWQGSNGISPAVGYFGPKTRAFLASMVGGVTPPSGGGVTPPSSVGVYVSLASDNPAANNVAIPASGNPTTITPVLRLNFSAGSTPVTVTGLNISRSGLSADQDVNTVYLMAGSNVLSTNLGIAAGVVNFSNSNGLFTVPANSTMEVTVAASFVSGTGGHTFVFSVASASAITGASFGGNFPIIGNQMTAASVSNLGGAQITNSSPALTSPGLSVNAGQTQFNVGQFTILAQNQAVQVRSIKLTNTGSVNSSDVSNIKLYSGSTQLGTAQSIGSGNTVVFDLTGSPLQLAAGQSAVLYVYADIVGGVNRNFQFSIQHNYDVIAQDMMFNIGILSTLNTGSFPMSLSYVSVLAGTLTVNRDANSPTSYILPGGTNQPIAKFDFAAAGEAVRITDLTVTLTSTSSLTNLRVSDDAGQQIGTTQATVAANGVTAYSSLNYLIPANTTRVVTVYVDLATAASGNYQASLSNVISQGYTSLKSATYAGPSAGNILSANSNLLTVAQNSGLGTIKVVAGTSANTGTGTGKIASFNFVAGPSSGIQVSNMSLLANTSSSLAFQNLRVMQGSVQLGQTQATIVDGTTYNFTAASPIVISAGQQATFDVYADAKTGITTSTFGGTNGTFVVSVPTSGVSAIAMSTNQSVTASGLPATGQTVQVASAGALTYAGFNMPQAAQVGMNVTGIKLATYRITGSSNENVLLKDVILQATSTNASMFVNYRLLLNGAAISSSLNTNASGSVTFFGVNQTIPQNTNPILDVVADTNSWNNLQPAGFETATANGSSTVSVGSLNFQGIASSQTGSVTGSPAGNLFNVLRTTLTPTTASGVSYTSGVSDAAVVGAFTFAAGQYDDAFITSSTVQHVYAGATTTNVNTVFYIYDGATLVGSSTASTTSASTVVITLNLNSAAGTGVAVSKGTSKTLILKADLATAGFSRVTAGSPISYQTKLTAWAWSDGTRTNLAADPSIPNQPIVGSVNSLQL